jgi:hypothetical protein
MGGEVESVRPSGKGTLLTHGRIRATPTVFEETEEIRVYYTLETPGTTWGVAAREEAR